MARTVNPCHLLSSETLASIVYGLGLSYQRLLPEYTERTVLHNCKRKLTTNNKPSRFQEGLLFLSLYLLHADILLAHIPTKGNLIGREVLHAALLLKELGHLGN